MYLDVLRLIPIHTFTHMLKLKRVFQYVYYQAIYSTPCKYISKIKPYPFGSYTNQTHMPNILILLCLLLCNSLDTCLRQYCKLNQQQNVDNKPHPYHLTQDCDQHDYVAWGTSYVNPIGFRFPYFPGFLL